LRRSHISIDRQMAKFRRRQQLEKKSLPKPLLQRLTANADFLTSSLSPIPK